MKSIECALFHNLYYGFFFFLESAASASTAADLPIEPQVEVDPNLTNFTRSDANCDKTGTCYDGKITD